MDVLLEKIDEANAQRDSAIRRRALKRVEGIRGVPGLPKAEDFMMPAHVNISEARIRELVDESQSNKRGLIMHPGGEDFHALTFLKPKLLNSWQTARAVQPPRTYKAFRGEEGGDPRRLYRFHAQPEVLPVANDEMLEERHKKWLVGHEAQRDRHVNALYYFWKRKRAHEIKEEKRKIEMTQTVGSGEGFLTLKEKIKKNARRPDAERAGVAPPAIDINPPLFRYTTCGSRGFQYAYPWQEAGEDMMMRTDYLGRAKDRQKDLDAKRRAEEIQRLKDAAKG